MQQKSINPALKKFAYKTPIGNHTFLDNFSSSSVSGISILDIARQEAKLKKSKNEVQPVKFFALRKPQSNNSSPLSIQRTGNSLAISQIDMKDQVISVERIGKQWEELKRSLSKGKKESIKSENPEIISQNTNFIKNPIKSDEIQESETDINMGDFEESDNSQNFPSGINKIKIFNHAPMISNNIDHKKRFSNTTPSSPIKHIIKEKSPENVSSDMSGSDPQFALENKISSTNKINEITIEGKPDIPRGSINTKPHSIAVLKIDLHKIMMNGTINKIYMKNPLSSESSVPSPKSKITKNFNNKGIQFDNFSIGNLKDTRKSNSVCKNAKSHIINSIPQEINTVKIPEKLDKSKISHRHRKSNSVIT